MALEEKQNKAPQYGQIINQKQSLDTTSTDDRGKQTKAVIDGLMRQISVTDAFGTALASTVLTT